MYQLIVIAIIITLFALIYRALEIMFKVPDHKMVESVEGTVTEIKTKKEPWKVLAKYIVLPDYRKKEMDEQLQILEVDMTAEEYVSSYLLKTGLYLAGTIAVSTLGIHIITASIGLMTILKFFKEKGKLQRSINYRKILVEEEAPFLIRFFITSLENTKNLIEIMERYEAIAKNLKVDIKKCIVDMKSTRTDENNIIYALEKLDSRLNVPIMSDFISGLIRTLSGHNQETYFVILEKDIKNIAINNLYRNADKVQKKVRLAFFGLLGIFICLMLVVFGIYLINFYKQ